MRIAFLLTQSLESPSGLGRYKPMCEELAHLGHSVAIYALHPNIVSLSQRDFWQNGVHVNYVAPMHVIKSDNTKSYYSPTELLKLSAQATWQLTRSALRTQADILHIGKPHPMNGLGGIIGRRRSWYCYQHTH